MKRYNRNPTRKTYTYPAGVESATDVVSSSDGQTEKHRRIVGGERQILAKYLIQQYTMGASIRELTVLTGRSYGFVHRMLTESGIQFRQRGGARRRKQSNQQLTTIS
jgi:hypothetical protein